MAKERLQKYARARPQPVTKALPTRHHGVKQPFPQTRRGAQLGHCSLCSQGLRPHWTGQSLSSRTWIPRPAPSPLGLSEALGRGLLQAISRGFINGGEKTLWRNTLCPTVTQSTPSPSPWLPSNLRVHNLWNLSFKAPSTARWPHVYPALRWSTLTHLPLHWCAIPCEAGAGGVLCVKLLFIPPW